MKETITAKVSKQAFATSKVASVGMMSVDGKMFDAKAFQRSPHAMKVLQMASVDDELTLVGHWEQNPRNNYSCFICDTAHQATEVANTHNAIKSDDMLAIRRKVDIARGTVYDFSDDDGSMFHVPDEEYFAHFCAKASQHKYQCNETCIKEYGSALDKLAAMLA